jgi:TolA-binding protein
MYKKIISLALLSVVTLGTASAALTTSHPDAQRDNIEELLERKRWADAKLSLLEYRSELDPVKDLYAIEWADYNLVCCHVELGSQEAERLMQGFMSRYPSSQHSNRMRFMLGCYHCDNGDFEAAEPLLDDVDYEALNAREKERYDIRLGYIRFVKGDYLTASKCFNSIPERSEYHEHALYYTAYIDYHSGRYAEAKSGFTALKESDAYRVLVPYYLLQIEYREQNYDYVVSEGERLLATSTRSVNDDLVRIIAESYFIKNDYSSALKYISQYPAEMYGRQENYIKGYSCYRLARYRDAIEPLRAVCGAMDSLTQNASYHLADCYLRVGDKESAAAAFSMASCEGFDSVIAENALLNYGRLKYELGGGRFNESLNVLKSYLERYPDSVYRGEVQTLLIAAYYNSKDYGAAYDAIKAMNNPDKELRVALQKVAVFRAVESIEAGDYDKAQELLQEAEAIGLSAKYKALATYWQGELAMLRGDYELAKSKYDSYIRTAPKTDKEYLMAHYGLGYAYFSMGDMESSSVAFDGFVREYQDRDSYMFDAQNRLGDTRFAQRQFNAARKAYKIALGAPSAERNYANYQLALIDGVEQKSGDKIDRLKGIVMDAVGDYVDDAWYELGRTYISMERYADGAATLVDFVESDATSPFYVNALTDIGLAYFNLGKRDEALKYYDKVVAYDPQSSSALEAMRGIREIYVANGDIDGYFAYAERSGVQSDMSIAARDSLTFAAARSAYLEGDVPKALTKLRAYLDDFESGYNRSEALFYLSDCYLRDDDKDRALESMEELVSQGTSQYSERVLAVMAPMCFDMEQYERAAKAYRNLYDVAHDDTKRESALAGYVSSTLKYASDDAIMELATEVDAMDNVTMSTRRQVLVAKARVLQSRGQAEAYDIYRNLAEDKLTVEGTEAYYRIVEDHYLQGNTKVAEQMVYDLGECGSVYWQAKCFILLGDIMRDVGNTFQARATYQSIVDGYPVADDGIISEVQSRINLL